MSESTDSRDRGDAADVIGDGDGDGDGNDDGDALMKNAFDFVAVTNCREVDGC